MVGNGRRTRPAHGREVPVNWTNEQLDAEFNYVKEERLGLLCEDREPTQAQLDIAIIEARRHIARLLRSTPQNPSL